MKKLKLIFLINSFSEYNNDFFLELSLKFILKVILIKKNDQFTEYKKINNKIYIPLIYKDSNKLRMLLNQFKPNIIIIGGYKMQYTNFLIEYSRVNNIKYLFWLEKINFTFILKKYLFYFFYSKKIKNSDGILAVGKKAYNFYKIFNKNILYAPYSISLKKIKHVKLLPKNKKIKILYVGQLIKRKGINLILESLKHLDKRIIKNIELTFVGKGPLEELIRKFSLTFKFIYLKKFKNRKDLNETYSKNNIFLYPSIYDGWGVAPMEAMASGMAIIISRNAGLVENLKHNKNGLIISANAVEISKAIKFYYNQKNKIKEHGKNNINLISTSALNSELNVINVTKFLINIANDSN
jgi:glycosyltransferase involved in cell wall biosynthesis